MKGLNKRRIGLSFWIALSVGAFSVWKWGWPQLGQADSAATVEETPSDGDSSGAWLSYLVSSPQKHQISDPLGRLKRFDPIFLENDGGVVRQVGHVLSLKNGDDESHQLHYAWYDEIPADECQLFQYHASGSLEEVVATMLPPEKRLKIQQRLAAAMSQHGEDLSRAFVPLVQQSLKRSMPVIEEELRASVARHRSELDDLVAEWKDEIVKERLIPLARKEILPIVREHGQPPAEKIGKEMWDRASLWRFGWRAVYDKTPLPKKGLVQEEWKRFVAEEAVPVIEKHMDEIVVAIQKTITDVASNKTIRNELGSVAEELASDPEARALVRTILKETLIDNDRLRDVWGEVWTSDEARSAIDMAGTRLEPIVREIGDDLFGSEEKGIDPNFARVLRNQILGKDRRWIMAWHTGAHNNSVPMAKDSMPYPLVYIAKE